MPTARTRRLAAALTALLISNALASQASATENGFTASTIKQQRSFEGERHVGNAAVVGLAASGITTDREVCVETSIRRYDPYSERIVTVGTKIVCR